MDIEIAALCEAATEQAGRLNILGAFESIGVRELPLILPQCAVVLRIRFSRIEAGEHTLRVAFVDQDGGALMPIMEPRINVPISSSQSTRVSNIIMHLQGVKFDKAGEYSVEVALDNRHEISLPLQVISMPKGNISNADPMHPHFPNSPDFPDFPDAELPKPPEPPFQ